ncbi:hypothetical protein AAFF_G00060260 [Aldrovandia affinis]|uniref:Uncharacterized protein n=1 Tax=Aldrovandia affinis TaxID=143900 RepID=A0AAD7WE82_9TELE|nr:hypothetical protein AAFF_G00060260 [Aldrovandia affinis]
MMQPAHQPDPQEPLLLSLGRRDTKRLLEAYVTRSLSLNNGSLPRQSLPPQSTKAKSVAKRLNCKAARSHSDGSRRPVMGSGPAKKGRVLSAVEASPTEGPSDQPPAAEAETSQGTRKGTRREKKRFKRFLGLFSKKGREEKEAGEPNAEKTTECVRDEEDPVPLVVCLPVLEPLGVADQGSLRPRKTVGRKPSFLKLSFHRQGSDRSHAQRMPTFRIVSATGPPEAVMRVEPMSTYYEKVSEELERIVQEVKDSPADESHPTFSETIQSRATLVAAEDEATIEKIISLLKQQGDAIDMELKQKTSISSFIQSLSYPDFQHLADRYVEEEVPSKLPEATPAPELVKFAFSLDFTAKVAGLSSQAVGRIMGFGNQYLQDRFTQMSKDCVPMSRAEAALSLMGPD